MLLSNSRIEKNDKICFYEQDILLDDHVYSGNIQVSIDVDYITPGLGIALVSNEGLALSENTESYMFRIGHSDYSIIHRDNNKTRTLEFGPVVNIRPFKEKLKLEIRKTNNRVSMYVDGKLITRKYLPTELYTFTIGYYSNAGNIINNISIASDVPDGWMVNMSNTNGGYIKFTDNKFELSNCKDKAEVEQAAIELVANTEDVPNYYLKYTLSKDSDIKAYAFYSDDDRYVDSEKNILRRDNSFSLQRNKNISIKFVGTIGSVSNIHVTNKSDDFYVETEYDYIEMKESHIKVKTSELDKIEFAGYIYTIPEEKPAGEVQEKFGIVKDNVKYFTPKMCGVEISETDLVECSINFNGSTNNKFVITQNGKTNNLNVNVNKEILLFCNMNCIMTKLILHKKDGTSFDVIIEKTKKQYVPATINSPIILTDDNNEPLDLSSSYRIIEDNDGIIFRFTNYEREIFDASNRITLTNRASEDMDSIVVYAIRNESTINEDKLMSGKGDNIKDISSYADKYDIINEIDLYGVDKSTGTINIFSRESEMARYKQLVVDYLKANSYAINYVHRLGSYELDISCNTDTKVYYDGIIDNDISNIENYKILNTYVKNNSYIVIKGR